MTCFRRAAARIHEIVRLMPSSALFLIKHKTTFLANEWLYCLGDLGEKPRQDEFQTNMIVSDIDDTTCHLPQCADAKLEAVTVPDFLLDREQMTEIGLRVAETCFQATDGFVLAKAMRDGHDERL
jgi:hypothetical protein